MSVIRGTVVDKQINVDIKGRSKTYRGYQIVYRTEAGEIQTLAKAMESLKYTPTVEKSLNELKVGDQFTVTSEKNDKGYLDVKSLTVGFLDPVLPSADPLKDTLTTVSSRAVRSGYGETKSTNTYETPEERKLKQRLIVRQAALNQALEYTGASTHSIVVDKVLETAEEFENWVYRGLE